MINFVNTGLDDQILKSMPTEDISEDLEKAMNKQGMVQKEVQVKGKNGTFTRKQWVKASDVQPDDNQGKLEKVKENSSPSVSANKPKLDDPTVKTKPENIKVGDYVKFVGTGEYKGISSVVQITDIKQTRIPKTGQVLYSFNRSSKFRLSSMEGSASIEKYDLNDHSDSTPKSDNISDPNMGKTLNVGARKATVKSYDKLSITEKREGANTIVSIGGKRYDYYSNIMTNGIGSLVPHQDDPKIDMSAAQFKPGDKGMITIRSETIPVKVVDRATLNGKLMYLVQEDRPLAHGTPKKMYWTSDYNIKPIGGNKPDKPTSNSQKTQDNLNTDSNRAKAENYLNYHLGSGETGVKVTSLETTKDGKIKVNYDVDVKISVGVDSETGQTQYEFDTESRSETFDSSDLGISNDIPKDTSKFKPSDFQFRSGGQDVADFINSIDKELGVKKYTNGNVGHGELKLENGETVLFGYDDKSPFVTWSGVRYRDAKELKSKMEGRKTLVSSQTSNVSQPDAQQSAAGQKPPAKGYVMEIRTGASYMYVYSEKPTKASAIEAYEKAGGKLKGKVTEVIKRSNQVKIDSNSVKDLCVNITKDGEYGLPSAGQKLSPADAKKKTQEITKGVSDKKSFMEKAKAQGITWKENDHEGINWMRCCMAMNKHFENGGTFDDSDVSSSQITQKKQDLPNQSKSSNSVPTKDKPLVTSETKSGRPYSLWQSGSKIYGSIPGKEDSRNARDIRNWSDSGFNTLDEVKDYIKKYF